MFKKYFKVDFFEGSPGSPLDEDQIVDMPPWACNYYIALPDITRNVK